MRVTAIGMEEIGSNRRESLVWGGSRYSVNLSPPVLEKEGSRLTGKGSVPRVFFSCANYSKIGVTLC